MPTLLPTPSALVLLLLAGCSSAPVKPPTTAKAVEVMTEIAATDAGVTDIVRKAHAYAVFPTVRKRGLGIGSASGSGWVVEKGQLVGTVTLSQHSIGLQGGMQTYRQLMCFKTPEAFSKFKKGHTEFGSAMSTAVLGSSEGAQSLTGKDVAVFVVPLGGTMFEQSLGGQSFEFKPVQPRPIPWP